jgi:adenine specific DNA methylase Mod
VEVSTNKSDVVADFFAGGGTTVTVAQHLGRRWIACDQSRVAVAITADRLTRQVEEQTGKLGSAPDLLNLFDICATFPPAASSMPPYP